MLLTKKLLVWILNEVLTLKKKNYLLKFLFGIQKFISQQDTCLLEQQIQKFSRIVKYNLDVFLKMFITKIYISSLLNEQNVCGYTQ